MEVTAASVGRGTSVGSVGGDKVDFVVICEDLGSVEGTVGSVGTGTVSR